MIKRLNKKWNCTGLSSSCWKDAEINYTAIPSMYKRVSNQTNVRDL